MCAQRAGFEEAEEDSLRRQELLSTDVENQELEKTRKMKIRPLGKRILVKRYKPPALKGALIVAEAYQEKRNEGIVLAVGLGIEDPLSVKVGDLVMFTAYAGTPVRSDKEDEELLIVLESEVLAVIT